MSLTDFTLSILTQETLVCPVHKWDCGAFSFPAILTFTYQKRSWIRNTVNLRLDPMVDVVTGPWALKQLLTHVISLSLLPFSASTVSSLFLQFKV